MGPPQGLLRQTEAISYSSNPILVSREALILLQSARFQDTPSLPDLLLRTVFLVAMATGHRVSQLAALIRDPKFTHFGPGGKSVTLFPKPNIPRQDERAGNRIKPVVIQAWIVDGRHHPLCPVSALRDYLDDEAKL